MAILWSETWNTGKKCGVSGLRMAIETLRSLHDQNVFLKWHDGTYTSMEQGSCNV